MLNAKVVRRGVEMLVLNASYVDKRCQPIKQELDANLQEEMNSLQGEARLSRLPIVARWDFWPKYGKLSPALL